MLAAPLVFLLAVAAPAATNTTNEDFTLRPPRGEMLPSFWEQNSNWIIPASVGGALFLGFLVWYLAKPKPVPEIPPEVRARKDLEALARQPLDRASLSRVSQIIKRYLAEAFGLPREELTTAEFCRAIAARPEIGSGVSDAAGSFLRKSDTMKFAPGLVSGEFVAEAEKLVDAAEARRGELRKIMSLPNAGAVASPEGKE